MHFRAFLWEAFKRALHKIWKFVEIAEVLLALALYTLSLFFHQLKDYFAVAFFVLVVVAVVTLVGRLFWCMHQLYREEHEKRQDKLPDERHAELQRELEQMRLLLQNLQTKHDSIHAEHATLRAERDRMQAELDTIFAANTQVYHQSVRGRFAVLRNEQVLTVEADGTLKAEKTVEFRALEVVNMASSTYSGDNPVQYFSEIGLKAKGDAHHTVVIMPAKQTGTVKDALLAFLPPVLAGTITSYTVTWQWPELFKPLLSLPGDSWRYEVTSAAPVPVVRFLFRLSMDLPRVRLSNIRQGRGVLVFSPKDLRDDGYVDYAWEMKDVAPGTQVEIRLEKV